MYMCNYYICYICICIYIYIYIDIPCVNLYTKAFNSIYVFEGCKHNKLANTNKQTRGADNNNDNNDDDNDGDNNDDNNDGDDHNKYDVMSNNHGDNSTDIMILVLMIFINLTTIILIMVRGAATASSTGSARPGRSHHRNV